MKAKQQHNWTNFLQFFTHHYAGRKTRMGVFSGSPDAKTDYWLEDGLPLVGIDIDPDGVNGPTVQIILQQMTHAVKAVRTIKFTISTNGDADGLEIETSGGETTVLRFEN